jgi:hypothetical protein
VEDSLKRLQRVRQNKSTASNLNTQVTVMSDDDKIRLQLMLDIVEFGKQLELKFGYKGDSNYDSLHKLVEEINQNVAVNHNRSTEMNKEPDVHNLSI